MDSDGDEDQDERESAPDENGDDSNFGVLVAGAALMQAVNADEDEPDADEDQDERESAPDENGDDSNFGVLVPGAALMQAVNADEDEPDTDEDRSAGESELAVDENEWGTMLDNPVEVLDHTEDGVAVVVNQDLLDALPNGHSLAPLPEPPLREGRPARPQRPQRSRRRRASTRHPFLGRSER